MMIAGSSPRRANPSPVASAGDGFVDIVCDGGGFTGLQFDLEPAQPEARRPLPLEEMPSREPGRSTYCKDCPGGSYGSCCRHIEWCGNRIRYARLDRKETT